MATARIEYIGELQTKCTHLKSGVQFVTDAPVDNNGKGSSFSPTDLVATSYVSCMMTIVGIHCNSQGLTFNKGIGEVTKIMASGPRRISELEIDLDLSGNDWTEEQQERIKHAALACPVAKSVDPEMKVEINFKF